MYKKKPLLIIFEGIEGSGKSYHAKKLFNKIKNLKLPVSYFREPGGTKEAEAIRSLILKGKSRKFHKFTDTLLYLAARNENLQKKLINDFNKKKIIICDRFIDSTIAYQCFGLGVKTKIVDIIHKNILKNVRRHFTFLLKIKIKESIKRIRKRKLKNRYDKFQPSFYNRVQKGFFKIARKSRQKYLIIDTSQNIKFVENLIYKRFLKLINK